MGGSDSFLVVSRVVTVFLAASEKQRLKSRRPPKRMENGSGLLSEMTLATVAFRLLHRTRRWHDTSRPVTDVVEAVVGN